MIFHKPIQLLSAGVALSISGLGIALICGVTLAQGYAAKSWPTTAARIVCSEVVVSKKAAGFRIGAPVFHDFYSAKIEYEYSVNGQDFIGHEVGIASDAEGFDPGVAETVVAKYPLGTQVTISYNARDPARA